MKKKAELGHTGFVLAVRVQDTLSFSLVLQKIECLSNSFLQMEFSAFKEFVKYMYLGIEI